ncbi:MAG: hypothetical protein AB7T49_14005 [Oligoflexales bacterium]
MLVDSAVVVDFPIDSENLENIKMLRKVRMTLHKALLSDPETVMNELIRRDLIDPAASKTEMLKEIAAYLSDKLARLDKDGKNADMVTLQELELYASFVEAVNSQKE